MECLREVLEEMGETEAAKHLPWGDQPLDYDVQRPPQRIEQAFSIAFQLLNMVEENASTQTRRFREMEYGLTDEPGCWGEELTNLSSAGFTGEEIAAILPGIRVEPVLTAHPTEAKRASVLEQHRAVYALLSALESEALTPSQREATRDEIKVVLERLWRSGEILLEKPDVASERRGVAFYLREVFPLALAQLDERLRRSWTQSGFDEALLEHPEAWPRLRFGSWVGGDRDGHPLVTAHVTEATLRDMRLNALLVIHRHLGALAERLPLSSNFQRTPPILENALERMAAENPGAAKEITRRYSDEPWRQYVLLLQSKLPIETGLAGNPEISVSDSKYRMPGELDEDLALLSTSLLEVGANRLAVNAVWPVRRALDVFGFHLAALDVRQNSAFHDKALSQILVATGHPRPDFENWTEEERLAFLNEELQSPRPFLYSDAGIGAEADAVLSCYGVLRRHIRENGREGIGSLIVSMTRQLSDLLVVFVLAREAGLMRWTPAGLACTLPVVPLFETKDDLERCPELIRQFLSHPVTARSLACQQKDRTKMLSLPDRQPIQQVMIGYSDSNKDCGTIASQWVLHKAQLAISQAADTTRIRFFHGRGGTISRGAGPTHRFLGALPHGSIQGDLRVTEQGETIAQKYSNLITATYNLELLMAGATGFSVREKKARPENGDTMEIWESLASASQKAYRQLIDHPRFMNFYSQATPIDALEISSIGSRPARRTGRRTLADLRAIPWVFSWNQSRYYLPGWFGVGAGLEHLATDSPEDFEKLSTNLRTSPFAYYVFTNVETNLASSDEEIMTQYAGLVSEPECREEILGLITSEFRRTKDMMSELFGGSLEKRRPRMLKTLGLRANALRALHDQQIATLEQWRAAKAAESPEAERLLPSVLLSINAIASGLRTTG
ncbi:MAG: phosphoenolpyruvate carboxylase [Terrimicrobiaceae bacterium]